MLIKHVYYKGTKRFLNYQILSTQSSLKATKIIFELTACVLVNNPRTKFLRPSNVQASLQYLPSNMIQEMQDKIPITQYDIKTSKEHNSNLK